MKKLSDWLLEENRYEKYSNTIFTETIGVALDEDDTQNWCGGTGKMMAISPEGDIYPCLRYLPNSITNGRSKLIIGDVDNGIESTKEQTEIVNMLDGITRRTQSTDECFYCPIASGCAWCSAYNYEETGTPNKRVTYICIMHKARVMANVYHWNRLYKKIGSTKRFPMNVIKEWALEIIDEDEYNKLLSLTE